MKNIKYKLKVFEIGHESETIEIDMMFEKNGDMIDAWDARSGMKEKHDSVFLCAMHLFLRIKSNQDVGFLKRERKTLK